MGVWGWRKCPKPRIRIYYLIKGGRIVPWAAAEQVHLHHVIISSLRQCHLALHANAVQSLLSIVRKCQVMVRLLTINIYLDRFWRTLVSLGCKDFFISKNTFRKSVAKHGSKTRTKSCEKVLKNMFTFI